MKVHKYINDPKTLLEQGKIIVTENADSKFIHRVSMVNLLLNGMSPKELSEFCGYSERTLQAWLKNVDESGWESLMPVKPTGRPARLTDGQISALHDAVKNDPANFGYNVWDGPTLSDYIKSKFGIDYGVRSCQYLLHRMGFSLIRPQTYPSLENPDNDARDSFKKKLTEAGRNENLIPVFQDEVHFQAQTTTTRKWAEKGSKPKVMSKPGKNNIAYSGFVIPETGELTVTKPGWFNYESVAQSLREFIKARPCPDGKKYCIILDNAPWHKKAIRLIWTEGLDEYSDIRENMEYISLPPYSPDLNPIEQVWRITRREKTHNRYFPSLAKLISVLDEYFTGFFKPNKQLRNLCNFSCFV